MAQSQPIIFPSQLLAKTLIKIGATQSIVAAEGFALRQYNHSAYIIKVLEAPPGIRAQVKNAALTSESEGQKQLVAILTLFETLSHAKKAEYITAFKACATLAGQGTREVVRGSTWQSGHIPPYYQP